MRCIPQPAAPGAGCCARPPAALSWLSTAHGLYLPDSFLLLVGTDRSARRGPAARSTASVAQCGGRATSGSPLLRRALVLRVLRTFLVLRVALFLRFVVRFFARFFRFAIALTSPSVWIVVCVARDRQLPDRCRALACYMSRLDATRAQNEIGAGRSVDCLPGLSPLVSRPGLSPRPRRPCPPSPHLQRMRFSGVPGNSARASAPLTSAAPAA